MRTIKLNVYEEQRKWIEQHRRADALEVNAAGEAVRAIYRSPLETWRGLIAPDGTVNVPDMDYYNSRHVSMSEMSEVLDELRPQE